MNLHNWLYASWIIGARYLVFAGIGYLVFYVLFRQKFLSRHIQHRFPVKKDYYREVGYSMLTIFIFGIYLAMLILNKDISQHTTLYRDLNEHSRLYFWLVFPLMAIIHDTYFYWTHRLMHHPGLFRTVHLVHHRSTNPSPWAAYAFHPLEAIVEGGVLVIFLFAFPVHLLHIGLFFLFMIIYNVYGHLGFELYPNGFNKTFIGRWINTSVNHNMHHQYFKGNYGLYFTFWDRVMGTLHPEYDRRFDKATAGLTTWVADISPNPTE